MSIEEKYQAERKAFMKALEQLLNLYDFSDNILQEAEKSCGFAKGYALVLFQQGLSEVVDEFVLAQDRFMLDALSDAPKPEKIREKIALSLNIRIKSFPPYLHKKIAGYLANPVRVINGLKYAWRTADFIWRFCGDDSTDFNYYSKRSLLSGVYLSSVVYYIADNSENQEATDEFIRKSIENVVKIGSLKKKLTQFIK
jgi:ubiquinone biosynthesis protein COQ9